MFVVSVCFRPTLLWKLTAPDIDFICCSCLFVIVVVVVVVCMCVGSPHFLSSFVCRFVVIVVVVAFFSQLFVT